MASLVALQTHGVPDWPAWGNGSATLDDYCRHVKSILCDAYASSWNATVRCHSMHPPYSSFESSPGEVVGFARRMDLDCRLSLMVRHWCRLRCGLPLLSHLRGRESAARYQDCVFCGQSTRKPVIHCVAICPHWCVQRTAFSAEVALTPSDSHLDFTARFLSRELSRSALEIVLEWAAAIDIGANTFWSGV